MNDFLQGSVFFGVFISIATYEIGALIKKKWNIAIFNPLLISIAFMWIMRPMRMGQSIYPIF